MVYVTPPVHTPDLALLLIRLIAGFSFLVAARNKSRDIVAFAKKNGLPVPVAAVVMSAEFVSGLALILGILAQFAALVIMLLMLGTLRLHIFKWRSPYWADKGGWEYDLMLFAMAAVISVFGAGSGVLIR